MIDCLFEIAMSPDSDKINQVCEIIGFSLFNFYEFIERSCKTSFNNIRLFRSVGCIHLHAFLFCSLFNVRCMQVACRDRIPYC